MSDNTIWIIESVVATAAPLILLFLAMRMPNSSRSLRILLAVLAVASALRAILCDPMITQKQGVSGHIRMTFDHWRSVLTGMGVGLWLSVLLNPEFWRLARYYRIRSGEAADHKE